MKHITVSQSGSFLGITGARLSISDKEGTIQEIPLSRIKTITTTKPGISISNNLILTCASRGIRIFFSDFRNVRLAGLYGNEQHAVVLVRKKQFAFLESENSINVAKEIVIGKILNQKSILLYFSKYHSLDINSSIAAMIEAIEKIINIPYNSNHSIWKSELMGYEGYCASLYWKALKESKLLSEIFPGRIGRGARDTINSALNLGYTILQGYVWNAILNAGLEPYAGILHEIRPGKPSLVLDLMEEYRPFIVDRVVIKMREKLANSKDLHPLLRKEIIEEVHKNFSRRIQHKGKSLRLETVLQRQVYRLVGTFSGEKNFKSLRFKW
jgi:CRISPR-associated protein Cas1